MLHLELAGRSNPPLPLARLRAGGQLAELRADDLRFSAEETAAPPCPGPIRRHCRAGRRAAEDSTRIAHLRVTPHGGIGSYRPRERSTRPGPRCYRVWAWRLAEEMTVKQIRIQRPGARRERSRREALPPDPRDPDVVRAKALARSGRPRRQVPGRAVPVPRPAET